MATSVKYQITTSVKYKITTSVKYQITKSINYKITTRVKYQISCSKCKVHDLIKRPCTIRLLVHTIITLYNVMYGIVTTCNYR